MTAAALEPVLAWTATGLVILGVLIATLAVYGMLRMPDLYMRLHAASKAVFLGVTLLLLSSIATADAAIIGRAALVAVFLLLTTPVAAHVIGRAAYQNEEPMRGPDVVDESEENRSDAS